MPAATTLPPSRSQQRSPVVAITATTRTESPGDPMRVRLNEAYVAAVGAAGGVSMVAPIQDERAAAAVIAAADALLLTGGEDVDPALYGTAPHPALGRVTPPRDRWELALVHAAREARVPTLAICRGVQVLNVAFGGTLVQDLPGEWPGALAHEQRAARDQRTHEARIARDSRLATLLGDTFDVNSMHHQAIARVADGLRVTAVAPDQVVEAAEWVADDWWAVGVQWHPEELDGADLRLFAAFVDAARARSRATR